MPLSEGKLALAKRGISFEPDNISLILKGRKIETRRIAKPISPRSKKFECYYGKPGDILWVKEKHAFLDVRRRKAPQQGFNWDFVVEYSNGVEHGASANGKKPKQTRERGDHQWRPARQMPKLMSRLMIELTDLRLERLNEMTEESVKAEGIDECLDCDDFILIHREGGRHWWVEDYAKLWDKINGKVAPWESNPWVWVLGFKRYS